MYVLLGVVLILADVAGYLDDIVKFPYLLGIFCYSIGRIISVLQYEKKLKRNKI